jgi:hypothetical protein
LYRRNWSRKYLGRQQNRRSGCHVLDASLEDKVSQKETQSETAF